MVTGELKFEVLRKWPKNVRCMVRDGLVYWGRVSTDAVDVESLSAKTAMMRKAGSA